MGRDVNYGLIEMKILEIKYIYNFSMMRRNANWGS